MPQPSYPPPECRFYNAKQLARKLGVDVVTVKNWTRAGILHGSHISQKSLMFYWPEVVSDIMRFREVPAND